MAFHNLLDEGPCQVWVQTFQGPTNCGVLSKGQNFSFHDNSDGTDYTVTLGNDGSVTLFSPNVVVGGNTQYNVWLIPQGSVSGRTAQLASVSMGGNYGRKYGFYNQSVGGSYTAFTQAQPALPNPMNLPGAPVAIGMSISALP